MQNRKCLGTNPCPNLIVDHTEYIDLLQKLRKIKGEKVFVRSGLRFDYIMKDKMTTLCGADRAPSAAS